MTTLFGLHPDEIGAGFVFDIPFGERSGGLYIDRTYTYPDDPEHVPEIRPIHMGAKVPSVFVIFVRMVHEMAPREYRTGMGFYRHIPPGFVRANQTHRDPGDARHLNFTCFVGYGTGRQLEFFTDADRYEQEPTRHPHGHVQMFTKDLHRRPANEGSMPGLFLSATLIRP
jgi:hypothetical protein